VHSPAGGQGMNTGIGDAVNLSWKIADVLKGKAPPSILETYETERITFAKSLVSSTDRMFRAMINRDLRGRVFRTFLLPTLAPQAFKFTAIRRTLFMQVSQVRISYHGSALSSGVAGDVQAGDRLPYVDFGTGDNFEPLQSLDWQIHLYGDEEGPGLQASAAARGLVLHVFAWTDAMEKAGLRKNAIYLVRPDGHVAFASPMQDVEALEIYLSSQGLAFGAPVQTARTVQA
jgi:hypothetical protein